MNKILVVIPNLGLGGAERFTVRLLNQLIQTDIEWHLALFDASGELLDDVPGSVRIHDIDARGRRAIYRLYTLIRAIKPDTVFAVQGYVGVILALIRRIVPWCRFRLVLRETSLPGKKMLSFLTRALYRAMYHHIDHIICQSSDMRDDVAAIFRTSPGRISVIPNGIDIPAGAVQDGNPLPEVSGPYVLAVGRFESVKNYDLLIQSFVLVPKEIHLVLIGYGSLAGALRELVDELGLSDRVHFTGLVQEPLPYIARASAVAITSWYEGFPNVLLEAISLGIPICGIDAPGGIKEIYRQGYNGYFTLQRTPMELAAVIKRTVSATWDAEAIRRDAAERFNIVTVAERYRTILTNERTNRYVFVINSLQQGGAERACATIAEALYERQLQFAVILFEGIQFYHLPSSVPLITLHTEAMPGWKKLLFLPRTWFRLKRELKRGAYTHVISFLFFPNYLNILTGTWLRLQRRKYRVIISTRTNPERFLREGFAGRINRSLVRLLYPRADLHISLTKRMSAILQQWRSLPPRELVIPNPYDHTRIQARAKETVPEIPGRTSGFTIVSVGRLIRLKRFHDIIDAVTQLPETVDFILVGDGPERHALEAHARSQGVDHRVHFVGQQDNPFPYMLLASVFILSSEIEGFPNAMVEAMCLGIPVISSDCETGPQEILLDPDSEQSPIGPTPLSSVYYGRFGVLYPVGDVKSLVSAVRRVMTDRELHQKYAATAYERSETFSVSHVVDQILTAIG
jgi:glycosyltransferase involved in cell wall biosynthesis